MNVSCDMVTDGGGWTVIQRRIDGSTDFYLGWDSYKQGFGSLTGNFWLGNDNIHRLTASGKNVLRVDLEDWNGTTVHVMYRTFALDDERNKYKLSVPSFSGSNQLRLGLTSENKMFFSTKDRNNFPWGDKNYAQQFQGGWWYTSSPSANLNGHYLGNLEGRHGMFWLFWRHKLSLKRSEMKIRHSSLN